MNRPGSSHEALSIKRATGSAPVSPGHHLRENGLALAPGFRPNERFGRAIDSPRHVADVDVGPEHGRGEGDVMVLAGEGLHAPVAARRAAEFVSAADDEASLTLLNVQHPETDSDEDRSPTERGEAVIEELAERAGIQYMSYDTEIRVTEDIEQAIIESAEAYDTICVVATRSGTISQAVFGSLPERVGADVDRTFVMARGPEESAMSIREAVLRRLEVY